jgi:hypothetical protein
VATACVEIIEKNQIAGITCPHYEAIPGRKHCRDYLEGGACSRPDELKCVEWLKVNGQPTPAPQPGIPTDLFGEPIPEPKPKRTRATKQRPTAARPLPQPVVDEPIPEREPLCGLTTADIDSFKALGVEVCLESEAFGEVWLVPEYTEADRKEIAPQHIATIAWAMEAFPGSKVVSFQKSAQQGTEAA